MSPDPMVPVKVGVIGIGNMGWHHARVLSLLKDADLVGVADLDETRGRLAREQFGCRWFSDYREMIQEVEAICTRAVVIGRGQPQMATLGEEYGRGQQCCATCLTPPLLPEGAP